MKPIVRTLRIVVLYAMLLVSPGILWAQPKEHLEAMSIIAKFTSSGAIDKTDRMLAEAGFRPGEQLVSQLRDFPAVRKIETAYWAAEINGNGQKLLALLSANLAREFESVSVEPSLRSLSHGVNINERISFGTLTSLTLPKTIDSKIANTILTITKYTDARALGGTRGILKYYYNLSDDVVYKLLRESPTNLDALLTGLEKAAIPPTKRERIIRIIRELQENYAAATVDKTLLKFNEFPEREVAERGVAITAATPEPSKKLQTDYDLFMEKRMPTRQTRTFSNMKTSPESFGGVILGNTVTAAPGLGTLKYLAWIPEQGSGQAGQLECHFSDGRIKVFPAVSPEDIYAAYQIIYNKRVNLNEGIGLTGAYYPDSYEDDVVFNSYVNSRCITKEQKDYYRFLCDFTKKIPPITDTIKSLEKKMKSELAALEEAKRLQSGREESIRKQISSDYTKYETYIKAFQPYYFKYESWKEKDPVTTKQVMQYIGFCNKIVLYPSVANLEIGRCLIRADVMPRGGELLIKKLTSLGARPDEIALCKKWLRGSDSIGWKFTDDVIQIGSAGELLILKRKSALKSQGAGNGILNFNAITKVKGKTTSIDFPDFYKVLPVLTRSFYDYNRLNQFARVMEVVRWAKSSGATFLNKPGMPPAYKNPAYTILQEDGRVKLIDAE